MCIFSHPPALWNTAKTAYTAYSYTQPADSASIASSAARTMANIAKPCLVEFIGTFFLTLTIGTAAGQGASLAPLAIGSTLVCAIYWGGHMSGANFNPAVSLAVCIRGKLTPVLCGCYMLAQFAASAVAFAAVSALLPRVGSPVPGSGVEIGAAFAAELVLTFALCHTVLHTATSSAGAGNSYFGLAIGFTVLSGAISVGGVSGGAFNPAVGVLSLLNGLNVTTVLELYFLAPLLGGTLAAGLFHLTHPHETSDGRVEKPAFADCAVEFVGTFMLCFTISLAASASNTSGLAPVSIGAMLMAQVYAGGPTSGGHYNPAVSLGVLVRARAGSIDFGMAKAVAYILTQSLAAVAASAAARALLGSGVGHPEVGEGVEVHAAWLAEFLGTLLLVSVVLQVATAPATKGNSFFGLAIGFTVLSMAVSLGPISGGAFNPAVGLLTTLARGDPFEAATTSLSVYLTACPAAGLLAGLLFPLLTNGGEHASPHEAERTALNVIDDKQEGDEELGR